MRLKKELRELHDDMISWRHQIHQNPEIAYEEEKTAEFVAKKLEDFGIVVHRGLGKTGVVGVIDGHGEAECKLRAIGLRADMDALPMTEQTKLPYASRNLNAMHACGHDGHTTMLLGSKISC